MLIPRYNMVGTLEWDLNGFATDLIRIGIESYLSGGPVECDQDCLFMRGNRLFVSFGRQKGHSTACRQVAENHPDQNFAVVTHNHNMARMQEAEYHGDNVTFLSVQNLDRVRGHRFDVVFVDVGWYQVVTDIERLEMQISPATSKLVYLFSDFVDQEKLQAPMKFRLRLPFDEAQNLGFEVSDLDIAPSDLRPEFR